MLNTFFANKKYSEPFCKMSGIFPNTLIIQLFNFFFIRPVFHAERQRVFFMMLMVLYTFVTPSVAYAFFPFTGAFFHIFFLHTPYICFCRIQKIICYFSFHELYAVYFLKTENIFQRAVQNLTPSYSLQKS